MKRDVPRLGLGLAVILLLAATAQPARAEVSQVRILEQFGIHYLPLEVMVSRKLLQKHAAGKGLGEIEVSLVKLGGGAAANDALLTGSIEFAAGGPGPLLTLWDKTRGANEVRAISSLVSMPMVLTTNKPEIKSLRDFTDKDRIAVPAIKVSIQAVVLQMAGKKLFNNAGHFDPLTVAMRHPDATAALLGGKSIITAHFGVPPFTNMQTKAAGIRAVTTSYEIVGGKHTQIAMYTTKKFREENPKTSQAFLEALEEAIVIIRSDRKAAARHYLGGSGAGSKIEPGLVEEILADPSLEFTTTPHRIMDFASFLHEQGRIKNKPASWKDLFWDNAHHLPGS